MMEASSERPLQPHGGSQPNAAENAPVESIASRPAPSLSVLQQHALLTLLRTADEYQNRLMRLLRDYELTPSQYHVLRILRETESAMPVLEIASRLIQVVPAITGLVRRLEDAGLVERVRGRQDRRVVFISLTIAGREKLHQLDSPICRMHQSLLGHLDATELSTLIDLLNRARETVFDENSQARPHEGEPIPTIDCDGPSAS